MIGDAIADFEKLERIYQQNLLRQCVSFLIIRFAFLLFSLFSFTDRMQFMLTLPAAVGASNYSPPERVSHREY